MEREATGAMDNTPEQPDQRVQGGIAEGDRRHFAGDYRGAANSYLEAYNHAAQAHLYGYLAALDAKLNVARELSAWQLRVEGDLTKAYGYERQQNWREAYQLLGLLTADLPNGLTFEPWRTQIQLRSGQLKGQAVSGLRRELELALLTDDSERALDLVRQLYDLQPDDAQTSETLARLRRDQRLREEIVSALQEAQLMPSDPLKARDALAKGIDALLTARVLPIEAHQVLESLLQDEGSQTEVDVVWKAHQAQLHRLQVMSDAPNSMMRQAIELAREWTKRVREITLDAIIASGLALGESRTAYRAAQSRLILDPNNAQVVSRYQYVRQQLLSKLVSSVEKRLTQARQAQKSGAFEFALERLESIDAEFYTPFETSLPGLLQNIEQVDALKAEADRLKWIAEKARRRHEQASALLDSVKRLFVEGQLERAERELDMVDGLANFRALGREVDRLRAKISEARAETARTSLADALRLAENRRRNATRSQHLMEVLENLVLAPQKINWSSLTLEEQERYYHTLDEIRRQRDKLALIDLCESAALEFERVSDFAQASQSLARALREAPEPIHSDRLEYSLVRVTALAAQQAAQQHPSEARPTE